MNRNSIITILERDLAKFSYLCTEMIIEFRDSVTSEFVDRYESRLIGRVDFAADINLLDRKMQMKIHESINNLVFAMKKFEKAWSCKEQSKSWQMARMDASNSVFDCGSALRDVVNEMVLSKVSDIQPITA